MHVFHDWSGWIALGGGHLVSDLIGKGIGISKAPISSVILAILLLSALFVDRAYMPRAPETPEKVDFTQIPMELAGGWKGMDSTFEKRIIDAFPRSQMLRRIYIGSKDQLELVVLYGPNDEFHTPESCLLGGGWVIEKVDISSMPITGESIPFEVKTLRVKSQTGQIAIVSYWLSSDVVRSATAPAFLWGRLIERLSNQKPSASAFVRVSDWSSEDEARMRANVAAVNKEIGPYIARMIRSEAPGQISKLR